MVLHWTAVLVLIFSTALNRASELGHDQDKASIDKVIPKVHEDGRCRCVCPNPVVVNATHTERKIYIQSVMPSECECAKVVLGQMTDITQGSPKFTQMLDQFCPRCSCKYETRKTGIIRVVVIIVIVVILSLSIYGLFLSCLDPWMKRKKNHYTQHSNEEICLQTSPFLPRDSRSDERPEVGYRHAQSVLDRVGQQQSKWQRTVRQQRRNIYDKRTMLN